jgi:hypothetical protein
MEDPTPYVYKANQQAAVDAVKQVENLSDEQLAQAVLRILKKLGYQVTHYQPTKWTHQEKDYLTLLLVLLLSLTPPHWRNNETFVC